MSQETRAAVIAEIRRWGEGGINEKSYHAALDAHEAALLREARTGVSDERMHKAVKDVLILNGVPADMAWDGYTIIDEAVADILRESEQVARQLAEALESIIVRCEEGDRRIDWLPTIASIARDALYEQHSASRPAGVR